MGVYEEIDMQVSASGDLTLAPNRDLILTSGEGVIKQDIAFRIRTNPLEFEPHPELGAGLDEIIGEPNNRNTCQIGETKISNALTYDGLVATGDLNVRGVPISIDSLVYYVFVGAGRSVMNVTPEVVVNLSTGLSNLPGA